MTRRNWLTVAALLFALILGAAPSAAQPNGGRRLVLVAHAASAVQALSSADVRKLFLGVAVEQQGRSLVALRNQTDPVLHEVFLQKVMFMSAPMYERTLLTRLLRSNASRPEAYESEPDLLRTLQEKNAVTYMWSSRAASLSDLRVVVELWRE